MRFSSFIRPILALVLMAGGRWTGPAAPSSRPVEPSSARAWPAPPAEPRITYLRSVAGPGDLGWRPSSWARLANLATGASKGKEKLVKPFGISLDEADNLCVTDTGTGRVWFFDQGRKRARSWDKVGPYAFSSPVAVAKGKGRIYVADSVLQKVVVFDEDGKLFLVMDETLIRPSGLALAGDKLFVADTASHQVVVFALNGKRLSQFGKRGEAAGELNFPTHLALDAPGRLWVTDSMNARIQCFDPSGRFLGQVGSVGDSSGHFGRPKGVAVDPQDHVYVVDSLFDNFQVFNAQGAFLLAVGEAGAGPGQFWLPAGITLGRDRKIYVADSYNGRIQVFQYSGKP